MPSVDLISHVDLGVAPWRYPGPLPQRSGLLQAGVLRPFTLVHDRRLGQLLVSGSNGVLDGLNHVLLTANVSGIDQRHLVAGVGSNASPAVLLGKLRKAGVSEVVPLVEGTVHGIAVGHSAHVSSSGYVAAAPYRADADAALWFALFDDDQLAALDRTEPNYQRSWMASQEICLELVTHERPAGFWLFRSRHGVIAADATSRTPMAFGSQAEIFRLLADAGAVDAGASVDRETYMQHLHDDESARDRVRSRIAELGLSVDDGLGDPTQDGLVRRYGKTRAAWRRSGPAAFGVQGTRHTIVRRGEPSVAISPKAWADLGSPGHVGVWARHPAAPNSVVARVTVDVPRPAPSRMLDDDEVAVDQVIRNALGVELREDVDLRPVRVEHRARWDWLLARPHFSLARVQPADLASVEQRLALLSPTAMSIHGLSDGDVIVVEGPPAQGAASRETRLSVHATPDVMSDRRERLSGGGHGARFPSARDALGVYPDLPWIFLDAATRAGLGLQGRKLGVVRIRASRGFQLLKELREISLLLLLAVIGLAAVFDFGALLAGVLLAVLAAALWLVRLRVKQRLETYG